MIFLGEKNKLFNLDDYINTHTLLLQQYNDNIYNITKKKYEMDSYINSYYDICTYKFKLKDIKNVAKKYKLRINGPKDVLLKRCYFYLLLSEKIMIIQKYIRGYLQRKINKYLWDWADLADLAQLVTVETWSTWFRSSLPSTLLLPSTLIVLYLSAPFIQEFPLLQRLFRFAVFAISRDRQLQQVPPWLIASGLWALWQLETEAVAKSLAATAGTNAAVLALLDAMRFAMNNDPAPTLLALLVTIRIYEDVIQETKKPQTPRG